MNIDAMLSGLNDADVRYLLIGGVNFMINHEPQLTYDLDVWIDDGEENHGRLVRALRAMGAEWGRDEASWGPVPTGVSWLREQPVYCLTTKFGPLDVFRRVPGMEEFESAWERGYDRKTASGVPVRCLSDADMLACQLALPDEFRRMDRVRYFQRLGGGGHG
jgi:hypothetical protein